MIFLIGIIKMKYFWLTKNDFKKIFFDFLNMNYKNEIFLVYKKQLLNTTFFNNINYKKEIF